jgi:hypothetical protein
MRRACRDDRRDERGSRARAGPPAEAKNSVIHRAHEDRCTHHSRRTLGRRPPRRPRRTAAPLPGTGVQLPVRVLHGGAAPLRRRGLQSHRCRAGVPPVPGHPRARGLRRPEPDQCSPHRSPSDAGEPRSRAHQGLRPDPPRDRSPRRGAGAAGGRSHVGPEAPATQARDAAAHADAVTGRVDTGADARLPARTAAHHPGDGPGALRRPRVRRARLPAPSARPAARVRVQFTIGPETHDRLRRLQTLLRREIPSGDPAQIVDRALTLLLEKVERRKFGIRPGTDRPKRSGTLEPPALGRIVQGEEPFRHGPLFEVHDADVGGRPAP